MRFAAFLGLGALVITLGLNGCGDDANAPAPSPGGGSGGTEPSGTAGESDVTMAGESAGGNPALGGGSGGGGEAAGAGGAPGPCLLGSEWQVVDDYVHSEGTASNVVGVAADSAGNVYAVGIGHDEGKPVGVLRKSADAGATWDDVPWTGALPSDIATDGFGNVFVTAGNSAAAVLKSDDQGESFESVIDIPVAPASIDDPCNTGFVAAGPAGVIVAGASCDSSGWVVLKSIDAGENWDTAFTFQLTDGKAARMQDVGVDAFGRVYGIGYALDGADTVHWLTVREGDGEQGVVSDDFQLEEGLVAQARSFGSPSSPIVVGFATDAMGVRGIARRQISLDEWATIDSFDTRATDVLVVGAQIVIAGELESFGKVSVRTRRSDDTGTTWNPLPDYSYETGQSSFSGALGADPSGNVYAGVAGRDADGVPHWIVRKLACQ